MGSKSAAIQTMTEIPQEAMPLRKTCPQWVILRWKEIGPRIFLHCRIQHSHKPLRTQTRIWYKSSKHPRGISVLDPLSNWEPRYLNKTQTSTHISIYIGKIYHGWLFLHPPQTRSWNGPDWECYNLQWTASGGLRWKLELIQTFWMPLMLLCMKCSRITYFGGRTLGDFYTFSRRFDQHHYRN